MDNPEDWRWIWVVAAVAFGIGEMSTPGSFFLLPFAIGAAIAATLAFADVSVAVEWAAFVGVSTVTLFALRPLARRLDESTPQPHGVGANRLLGRTGTVLDDIPEGPNELGTVRVDREEWRAESVTREPLTAGTRVRVADVQGTRLVVEPLREPSAQGPADEGQSA